jgi:SMC interacting uncharacterized protein involved in chromosome segregation
MANIKPITPDTNSNTTTQNSITEEYKEQSSKYNLNKFEYDLYHEEDDVAEKIIRVKRFSFPNKGERWKIFDDTKVIFIVEGAKLTSKQREFLQTVDGMNFLINQFKTGIKSFNALKNEIKKILENKED